MEKGKGTQTIKLQELGIYNKYSNMDMGCVFITNEFIQDCKLIKDDPKKIILQQDINDSKLPKLKYPKQESELFDICKDMNLFKNQYLSMFFKEEQFYSTKEYLCTITNNKLTLRNDEYNIVEFDSGKQYDIVKLFTKKSILEGKIKTITIGQYIDSIKDNDAMKYFIHIINTEDENSYSILFGDDVQCYEGMSDNTPIDLTFDIKNKIIYQVILDTRK